MPLRRHIGQLVIVGFDGFVVPADLRLLAREFDLGGVILFARNVDAPGQVAELSREIGALAQKLPVWVSVDQEGGRVARLRAPFTEWPPMRTLGQSGDERLAARFARALAVELAAVGITLDYAPVLDVDTNPKNVVIGDRALAAQAETVARLGSVIIRTLQANGIAACGKHFPGHGDTTADSHVELPVVEQAVDRLRAVELVPFRAAVAAGVASIMTAHVLVPALDEEKPATLSGRVVHDLLREELGFDGMIVSDDLEMRAISSRYSIVDAAIGAVGAGCDALLICGPDQEKQVAALEGLIRAVETEALPRARVDDALARQRRVKERFLDPSARPPSVHPASVRALVGRDEHLAIAEEMARYL